jgi:predicted nicotinamide N-methyase
VTEEAGMDYRLVTQREAVGPFEFRLRCLRDFDEAVDDMFCALDAVGDGERLMELCPFFGKLWPSARALARHLVKLGPQVLAERKVLEAGCGLALPSMVAARLGARVTATDFHPDVAGFLSGNLAMNGMSGLDYVVADWQDDATRLGLFDVVVGSDVLYDRMHVRTLSSFLLRHTAPGALVVISDPGRAYLQDFTSRMEALNFTSQLRIDSVADGAGIQDVYVLEFRRGGQH